MRRVRFLKYCLMLLAIISGVTTAQVKTIFSDPVLLEQVKQNYGEYPGVTALIENAGDILDDKVKTVTSVKSPLGEGTIHDYYSESPYWWPDPDDADAVYIKKDGRRNPDRFLDHKVLIGNLHDSMILLGIAAYLTGEQKYADKAAEYMEAWWVNSDTKMAPHLKYAQMVRNGKNEHRGVGIIETHRLASVCEALILLEQTGLVDESLFNGVKEWFGEYYEWLTESPWGIDEKERGNNHSSWWAAQAASIAVFIGKTEDFKKFYIYGKEFLIDNQITSDCTQPHEDKRTLSLNYNNFNLDALTTLASAVKYGGYDLFGYVNENGCGITGVAERIVQYLDNPGEWKLEQIKPFRQGPRLFPVFLALKGENEKFGKIYIDKFGDENPDEDFREDPLLMLLDAEMKLKFNK